MRALSSTTCGQYITSWASCVRNVLAACPSCRRPSATMARKTTNPQGREVPMRHLHWHNHLAQSMLGQSFLNRNLDGGSKGGSSTPQAILSGIAPPHQHDVKGGPDGGGATCQPNTSPAPQSSCIWTEMLLSSTNPNCLLHLPKMLDFMNIKPIES